VVVFINGLNDLTNGPTSKLLTGDVYLSGTNMQVSHAHDFSERAADYLKNMGLALNFATRSGIEMLVVLQPALTERSNKTSIEEKLLSESLLNLDSATLVDFRQSYQLIRNGITKLSQERQLHYVDCSRIFDSEKQTVFADLWHFSDTGHKILGETLAKEIYSLLRNP
jgi:hypothetical protein